MKWHKEDYIELSKLLYHFFLNYESSNIFVGTAFTVLLK